MICPYKGAWFFTLNYNLNIVALVNYNMYKIRVFCPFASSAKCKEVYERINYASELEFYGKDKSVVITDGDDYTHAIIINTVMPSLAIPRENVIGLAFEPIQFLGLTRQFVEYAQKNIGKYYIGDKHNLPQPFTEHFGYMWHSRPPKEITHKPNLMSIIVSEKQHAPGHMYRHELVKQIINYKLPIDIYGRGSNKYTYNRIKGNFDDAEPYDPYLFSVCIENFQSNHYFSEKIITPLLYNCMPIYLGCKNIDTYFDNIIRLSGDVNHDILLLIEIIKNPNRYYIPTYNKKTIKTVNLLENVAKLYS